MRYNISNSFPPLTAFANAIKVQQYSIKKNIAVFFLWVNMDFFLLELFSMAIIDVSTNNQL